jgi:hypothetical protein
LVEKACPLRELASGCGFGNDQHELARLGIVVDEGRCDRMTIVEHVKRSAQGSLSKLRVLGYVDDAEDLDFERRLSVAEDANLLLASAPGETGERRIGNRRFIVRQGGSGFRNASTSG